MELSTYLLDGGSITYTYLSSQRVSVAEGIKYLSSEREGEREIYMALVLLIVAHARVQCPLMD